MLSSGYADAISEIRVIKKFIIDSATWFGEEVNNRPFLPSNNLHHGGVDEATTGISVLMASRRLQLRTKGYVK